jgi:hypothetical protein
MDPSQAFFEREFAHHNRFTGFERTYEGLGIEKILSAEFLNSAHPPHGHFKTWERLKILPFLDDNALESIGNPLTRPG